jgi:hypothetical protein
MVFPQKIPLTSKTKKKFANFILMPVMNHPVAMINPNSAITAPTTRVDQSPCKKLNLSFDLSQDCNL